MMETVGIEPTTACLQGKVLSQLSCIPIEPGGACSIRTNEPLARPRLSKPLPWTSRPMLQRCPVTSSGASQSLRPVSTRGRCNSPGLALVWSGRQKSNLRPDAPKATALPTALRPDIWYVPGRPCTIRTCDCLSQSQVPWSSLANGLWMVAQDRFVLERHVS